MFSIKNILLAIFMAQTFMINTSSNKKFYDGAQFRPKQLPQGIGATHSNFQIINVPVLQQDSSTPWTLHKKDLETDPKSPPSSPKAKSSVINHGLTVFGTEGLYWKNIRQYDGTNCGYHALKNISYLMDNIIKHPTDFNNWLSNPSSLLNQHLADKEIFINHLGGWAPYIFNKRKTLLEKGPNDFHSQEDLDYYINKNNGHINVDMLDISELEELVKLEMPKLQHNVLVIQIHNYEKTFHDPILMRINAFRKNSNDLLGILWTEQGFNHWVGYVAWKQNNNVTIYYTNSLKNLHPQRAHIVLDMLKP